MKNYTATLAQRSAQRSSRNCNPAPRPANKSEKGRTCKATCFRTSWLSCSAQAKSAASRSRPRSQRFRYYIGQTSPEPYTPSGQSVPKRTVYSIPVKTVIVSPFSIAGEDGKSFKVTLPAAPWEVNL